MSRDTSFAELLDAVAAQTPAPGGGSVSAYAGALAAALVEMASRFASDAGSAERAAELRAELVALGEQDLQSYEPVLEAMRLPPSDPSRAERLGEALSAASETPLAIARACASVAEVGEAIAAASKSALTGDAVAGVLLAEATCAAAARLVEINLAGCSEDPRLGEVRVLSQRALTARESVLSRS